MNVKINHVHFEEPKVLKDILSVSFNRNYVTIVYGYIKHVTIQYFMRDIIEVEIF